MDIDILSRVRSPASYMGCEWGAVRKTPENGGPRWALAFPDTYEIGMSHLGLKILYHILNENPASAAERVFAPQMDMQDLLRERGAPLCSLESQTPLDKFDVVGFSLLYELGYTNVVRMLELGRIPLRWDDRSETHPLVIAGGPCVTNPEPVAPFFDAFAVGEGEDVALEINAAVHEWKKSGRPRRDLLESLSRIDGVYVPAMGVEGRSISARKVADLDAAPFPTSPVVPLVETTHDRAVIEVARGCPRACRFCHAGFLGRPYRERRPATVWKLALETLANTGYQDLTMLSLSAGDYRCLLPLVKAFAAKFGGYEVAVSLPSLRADSLSSDVVEHLKSMRKTGFTIAPEAATDRLRAVINKDITRDEILSTARLVFENGWDLIKLYFMFGLPTETDEDMREMGRLVRDIRSQGLAAGIKPRINVGISAFVPKPHTPFQWEAMLSEEEIEDRLSGLKGALRIPGVKLKWSPAFMSVLEGVFARGDQKLADVIGKAVELGAAFDAWGDSLKPDLWKRAFDETGLDPAEFASRPRDLSEKLPWEHIATGVSKEWLLEERERALSGEATQGCKDAPCPDPCGACGDEIDTAAFEQTGFEPPPVRPRGRPEEFSRCRVVYAKTGPAAMIGHLDNIRSFQRSLRRAGLEVQYTEGYHPKPRLSFGEALPVGVGSLAEMADVWVHKSVPPSGIPGRLNGAMPSGFEIKAAGEVSPAAPSIEKSTRSVTYRFEADTLADGGGLKESLERFEAAPDRWIEKITKSGVKKVDLKEALGRIELRGGGAVDIEFAFDKDRPRVRPAQAYEAVFGPLPDRARVTKVAVKMDGVWPFDIEPPGK